MTREERQTAFEALVLQALWIIIRSIPHAINANVWRSNAIAHLDVVGNQSDGAREHRRNQGFPL
jgi:hypothetical protein